MISKSLITQVTLNNQDIQTTMTSSTMLAPPNKLRKVTHQRLTGVVMSKDVMCQLEGGSLNTTPSRVPKPLTAIEQYWATRALKAEALLAAQDNHRKEFKTMEHAQDMKREVLSSDVQGNIEC
jgi:hypothetical protein